MAEQLMFSEKDGMSKEDIYISLTPQIKSLIEGETDLIANLANVAAALKEAFNFFWVGFYIVKSNQLVLGPFQGPIACTRIAYGKGVCGASWRDKKAIIVDDVNLFPGHIACSSFSQSEIVIPIVRNSEVVAVLDVDSDQLGQFDEIDRKYLSEIVEYLNF
ncbi:MAG TPA: GAF domain-containing protein [Dysgonamonadaceae bacterium]|nr:GAF domain-containing protein [Dysgonamonadaceae bacterium]